MQRKDSFKNYSYKDLRTYNLGQGPLASALCYTQDGDLIGAESYYRYSHFEGKIFILDPKTLLPSKTIIDRPANALCSNPDGTLFVGTCDYSVELGSVVGVIDVLNSTGHFIKTLVHEPASSLCYRPDGMLLAGTCYYSLAHSSVEGSIVIRDPSSGKKVKTLIDEPASAICYLPDGTLLTSTCYSSDMKYLEGSIVMRDSLTGQIIRTLQETPTSAMCYTPKQGLLKSAFWNKIPVGIGVSTTYWIPNKELYYKSRQTFIDTAIEIANAYYSLPIRNKAKCHLSIFPQEILFMIILEYGKTALGMNNEDVFKCFKLILQNF